MHIYTPVMQVCFCVSVVALPQNITSDRKGPANFTVAMTTNYSNSVPLGLPVNFPYAQESITFYRSQTENLKPVLPKPSRSAFK